MFFRRDPRQIRFRLSARGDSRAAFTLIELLIVVAILAVLSAISVPSFTEAISRARVSRVKADLRVVTMAIESYRIDHGLYPTVDDEQGRPITPYPPVGLGPEVFETRLPARLTTPVGYLSVLPEDPFPARSPDSENPNYSENDGYHYGPERYAFANNGEAGVEKFKSFIEMMQGNRESVLYFVSSHGPDRDHDDDEDPQDVHAAAAYDPTNGTLSSGDIVIFGPSGGFNH